MSGSLTPRSTSSQISDFLAQARKAPTLYGGRGRLIFALDATMSRQPTWDMALSLQARMFEAAAEIGGLDVQLVYFRGQGECVASRFVSQGEGLADLMRGLSVRGGVTQLRRVLVHARNEAKAAKVGALVFVGDAMEEEADAVLAVAGELALSGVKAFMFQEGDERRAMTTFKEIARLTGGAYGAFDAGAAARLATLLRAAAAYAAGGRSALEALAAREADVRPLLAQMRG
ncbi:MAG: VWA domain-containing protein [Pseudomonadota bacterium]|nr:VWA domain-containing protein [Pseudomonadota bacterium]